MEKIKYVIFLILLSLGIHSNVFSQIHGQNNYRFASDSSKLKEYRKRFFDSMPKPTDHVNDYENLYSGEEETTLNSLISHFEDSTTIQAAIITFDSTMLPKDSLNALTFHIAKAWGVGQKNANNGVVIGICKGYKRMRIQNGLGIEKFLSNTETKHIIDSGFIPWFREEKYFEGTREGLLILMKVLKDKMKNQ